MWRCSSSATQPHASRKPGSRSRSLQVVGDEVLAGLREQRLDDEVVHRHGPRERGARAVRAQRAGDLVEQRERLAEAPRELRLDGAQRRPRSTRRRRPTTSSHEALEEDRVARLVDLLGGEEVLLLLARGGVDERREVVGRPRPRRGRTSRSSTARRGARARSRPRATGARSSVKSISIARQLPRSQRA